jgi:hypothetical protein
VPEGRGLLGLLVVGLFVVGRVPAGLGWLGVGREAGGAGLGAGRGAGWLAVGRGLELPPPEEADGLDAGWREPEEPEVRGGERG